MTTVSLTPGALAGLKVVELGQLIAGPFAGKTLADFGADVIKIEPPGAGDPLRKWRLLHRTAPRSGGRCSRATSARSRSTCATPKARTIARQLIARGRRADRELPPRHDGRLGPGLRRAAAQLNPGLIMLRISGYGQTGPYRDRPGFGVVGEAMGGLRHLTGEPGRVPVRVRRQHRRHAGGAARRDRRADGAATTARSTAARAR